MMRNLISISMIMLGGLLTQCSKPEPQLIPANLDHALHLVDSTLIEGEMLHWISIYADAPSYDPINASGEGVTCVDDVGRFLEVLEFEINQRNRQELLPLAEGMIKFLLHLSREDGQWYNFLFADGSINTTYQTSIASFGWWAVRGLRGLGAGYRIFSTRPEYKPLSEKISMKFLAVQPHLDSLFSNYGQMQSAGTDIERPHWLLSNAPDQSAELLMALAGVHGIGPFHYELEINYLAEGLMGWQYLNPSSPYNGMYLCWENTWHGWGNNQSLALLQAYNITGNESYLKSVKTWADNFVPTLIKSSFPAEISLDSLGQPLVRDFPQIAYGIGSTYRGLHTLAAITDSPSYHETAERIFGWFKGENAARTPMYDPQTGRCYDGIISQNEINHNSGAESTIECLLALQARGGW